MDPLNKQERTEAFIKMLIIFIITVTAVVLIAFIALRWIPEKEKEHISETSENYQSLWETKNQNNLEFLTLADSARSLYIAYNKAQSDVARGRINNRFSAILNKMENYSLNTADDTVQSDLYGHMVDAFNDLFAKMDVIVDLNKQSGESDSPELTDDEKLIQVILSTIEKNGGNKREAARELGMTERRLRKKMKELGI